MKMRNTLMVMLVSGLLTVSAQTSIARDYYHHGGHHGHGHGGEIAAALILGGLFGYMIHEDQYRYRSYNYYGYRSYGYPRSTVVYERVEQLPAVISTKHEDEFAGQGCLMTREYTTTITIDGVDREAYGTRCMLSDGSWIMGQPKIMPEL